MIVPPHEYIMVLIFVWQMKVYVKEQKIPEKQCEFIDHQNNYEKYTLTEINQILNN